MQTSAMIHPPTALAHPTPWDAQGLQMDWAARAPTVFASPLFQLALRKAFAPDSLPAIAAYNGDGLAGLLPLCRLPTGRAFRETGFQRNAHTLRNHLLTDDPAVILAMLRLWRDTAPADTLLLENLPSDDALIHSLTSAAHTLGLRADAPTPARTLAYAATDMDYDTYLATRSGQFRRQIRKRARELQSAGEFRIESLSGDALLAAMPDWRSVVDRSWQGTATANTPADWALHTALAANGTLWLARLNTQPIAALRMLQDAHAIYVHTMHFDQTLRDHAPGLVLFDAMMHDACTRRIPRVDFNGTSPFFARWATGQTRQMSLRIYRASLRGRGAQTMRSLLHRLRKAIDAAPEILPERPA